MVIACLKCATPDTVVLPDGSCSLKPDTSLTCPIGSYNLPDNKAICRYCDVS